MSEQRISFGCTALLGTNKGGTLKPNADGYYKVILGALDFENSYGAQYPLQSAKEVFKESSGFMRRLRAGYCRGEYGHPKRLPGQVHDEFIRRIMTIEETRICMHIAEAWIDYDSVKYEGKKIVTIWGLIRPEGPYGAYLKDSLDNPKCNVAFSLRSITLDEYIQGRLYKNIDDIACWDFVVEPGLKPANKYANPALEDFGSVSIPMDHLHQVISSQYQRVGMESNNMLLELQRRINITPKKIPNQRPPSDAW